MPIPIVSIHFRWLKNIVAKDNNDNNNNTIATWIGLIIVAVITSDVVCTIGSSDRIGFQLAVYMGIKELYIIGCDNSYGRVHRSLLL